ncbi:14818_t:CDS:2 [Entrophospora sp. SA101]|nr:14818_t:CDS:2 [Entrophospora sp. SA101]
MLNLRDIINTDKQNDDLKRFTSANEYPLTFVSFIACPEIEKDILKTRVGFEIKNIVEHNELTKTLKDELNATFEYMYIYSIKNILGPVLEDNSSNKYPQIARTY